MQVIENDHDDWNLGRQLLDAHDQPSTDRQGIGSGNWLLRLWIPPRIVAPELGDELADDTPREVGLRLFPAHPDQHPAGHRVDEPADKAGLANAPSAFDHDEAMLSGGCSLQLSTKLPQLGMTPHE